MSTELAIGLVTGIVGAIFGGIATILVKVRAGDFLNAGQARQATAVDTMAKVLQESVTGLVETSTGIAKLSMQLEGHASDESLRFQHLRSELDKLREDAQFTRGQIAELRETNGRTGADDS